MDISTKRKKEKAIKSIIDEMRSDHEFENVPECPEHRVIKVGDKLSVGNLIDCVAVGVSNDSKIIIVESHDKGKKYGKPYDNGRSIRGGWYWYEARKTEDIKDTKFRAISDATKSFFLGRRIASDMSSLTHSLSKWGFWHNDSYQRSYVWTEKDKEALISSIFRGIPIGEFLFIRNTNSGDYRFEVLDGFQRASTIFDFYMDKIKYKGYYWSQMSFEDRLTFKQSNVSWVELDGDRLSPKSKAEIFIISNFSGVPQTDEHLNKVREFIKSQDGK